MSTPTPPGLTPRITALGIVALIAITATWALSKPAFKEPFPNRSSHKDPVTHRLPVYGNVNTFSFRAQDGKPVSSHDLKGKIWIADFIYTSCTDECPLMTQEMARIQKKMPAGVMLVSFSVDPEHDTPAVLKQYAERFQARSEHWKFLTGPREELYQLAKQDFHLAVQATPPEAHHNHDTSQPNSTQPFLHSQKFVLVDQHQQIRGYYDSTDSGELKKLLEADLPSLLSAS